MKRFIRSALKPVYSRSEQNSDLASRMQQTG